MQHSVRTILKTAPNKHNGAPMQLVHKTAGIEPAGAGMRETGEAWGVLYPEANSGQWYLLQSVAEQVFRDRSTN